MHYSISVKSRVKLQRKQGQGFLKDLTFSPGRCTARGKKASSLWLISLSEANLVVFLSQRRQLIGQSLRRRIMFLFWSRPRSVVMLLNTCLRSELLSALCTPHPCVVSSWERVNWFYGRYLKTSSAWGGFMCVLPKCYSTCGSYEGTHAWTNQESNLSNTKRLFCTVWSYLVLPYLCSCHLH